MKYLFSISLFFISVNSLANHCRIFDSANNFLGAVAPHGAKVAAYNATTQRYRVLALVETNGLIKRVATYNGALILFKTGRTSSSGELYDFKDAHLLGRVDGGKIFNATDKVIGTYSGCEEINEGQRLSLVGAGAHQLLLFNPSVHYWDKVMFEYCNPREACVW